MSNLSDFFPGAGGGGGGGGGILKQEIVTSSGSLDFTILYLFLSASLSGIILSLKISILD